MTHRVGVIGSLVWDTIHGRDPAVAPVEEWGGIAYALAGLEASLADDWQMVPLIRVGRDLAPRAAEFLRSLSHLAPGARVIEVDAPNNRVELHYEALERRCERMSGGVPAWTWQELGPLVADLDALYLNFISGFELCLGTAQALRQGFRKPIYADLHSLFLGMQQDGMRHIRPLPDAPSWFECFDVVQLNEEEMRQLSDEPLGVAAHALARGSRALLVTLGPRGVAYVADPAFDGFGRPGPGGAIRSARLASPVVDAVDPTGCGDVFGAATMGRLLAGDTLEEAIHHGNRLAARNATLRGASDLAPLLRGALVGA
jgi:hypothetical protein